MTCTRFTIVVVAAGMMTVARPLAAQEAAASLADAATDSVTYDVHGSFDLGYRFTTIKGSDQTFRQLFDLSSGPRLMAVDLYGQAGGKERAFADTFALSASGIGGDPFPTVQFTLNKRRVYDLRINWRRSRFFDIAPATPASIGGLDTRAVTDRHGWDTSRQIGNVAFVYDATTSLHVLFNYSRVAREGGLDSTRALDFVGAPSAWGSFARANPYPVTGPVDDSANRVTGGLSYSGTRWSVHYQAGYQVFNEHLTLDPISSPLRSINVADRVTTGELLSMLTWSQSRRLTSPASELTYVVQPVSNVEWRGEYLFYQYRGPFQFDASFQGVARTSNSGTTFSPYSVAATATGDVTAPNHFVGQGITYAPSDRWKFDVDYRYSRFATESRGTLGSLLALFPPAKISPVSASEDADFAWRQALQTLDATATFEPTSTLTIRPGVRLSRRDIEKREDGVIDPATSERIRSVWPELTVAYRPKPEISVRGAFTSSYSDASYTRLSPVQRDVARVVLRVEPLEGFTIEANVNRTDAELLTASFVSHTRLASVQGAYAFSDRFTVTGGLDYQSFLGLGSVSFLRGAAPIADDQMRDREIDRIWQAGAIVKATSRLGVTATANFIRTTGADAIAGEPPLYGPVTFPYATGSIYYDIARVGRVSLDLQRTYMFQELLPLNDFRASLLTIHYSRGF